MHKITKGLKKKKKGNKKSKHKEEELFKPEELEAYRREHQEEQSSTSGQNEEWRKFLALASGVDDVLKKTQGDLDRIKSTSFFQRVPPPSERQNEAVEKVLKEEVIEQTGGVVEFGVVHISESEDEEEDDIFDTTYIDALAAGEVKLAYIPESPTEEKGDDPFDTSIAERAILGPAIERKGKKLVPIGAAVEVLTGRVQISTCVRPVINRRQIHKKNDLLLGNLDDGGVNSSAAAAPYEPKLLFDDASQFPLAEGTIDLSKTLPNQEHPDSTVVKNNTDVDDEEFAILAAESLSKPPIVANSIHENSVVASEGNWTAFTQEIQDKESVDPFDTTFAENILPGRAELKIIEDEILNEDLDFDPRAEDALTRFVYNVSIKVTDSGGQRESISSLDRVSEAELNLITPTQRDLLGGSNTDLANLSDKPLKPCEQIDDNYIEYCDPFDTSIVETAQLPGHTELKYLEKELLGELNAKQEFDPKAVETKERTRSRPDVLNLSSKAVSFDLPSPHHENEQISKIGNKPLTPFYVEDDPFDTSFVSDLAPGRVELKLLEDELFDPAIETRLSNDREEERLKLAINKIVDVKSKPVEVDLLAGVEHEVAVKVLTPAGKPEEVISYTDPFDTSIASNIVPGKAELKLLETELIHSGGSFESIT